MQMSKPIKNITITTSGDKSSEVSAIFDTGSFYTIVREDRIPSGAPVLQLKTQTFRIAGKGGNLHITGDIVLTMTIGEKMIKDSALVSPDLVSDILLGAKTMQAWDISIRNKNGKTEIYVGHDMRDPEIMEVD